MKFKTKIKKAHELSFLLFVYLLQILISIQCSAISICINTVIVTIFKKARPKQKKIPEKKITVDHQDRRKSMEQASLGSLRADLQDAALGKMSPENSSAEIIEINELEGSEVFMEEEDKGKDKEKSEDKDKEKSKDKDKEKSKGKDKDKSKDKSKDKDKDKKNKKNKNQSNQNAFPDAEQVNQNANPDDVRDYV